MEKWIFLLGFLKAASCMDTFHYAIHGDEVNFMDAISNCNHEGTLTSLATKEEVLAVQQAVSEHVGSSGTYTYWIGLLRNKSVCLDPDNKLMGFQWIDGGKNAEEIKWKEEPTWTCTHELCVFISINYDGTSVVDWGLKEDQCHKKHPFICKVKGKKKIPVPKDCPIPTIVGTHDHIHQMGDPSKLEVICKTTNSYNLTCSPETLEWTTIDGVTVNFENMCIPCQEGYEKSRAGQCEDIDECEKQPCGPNSNCVNTEGSFHCKDLKSQPSTSASPTDPHTDPAQTNTEGLHMTQAPDGTPDTVDHKVIDVTEASGDYSHIYIPIIIAILALLLLLVVILAIVACCRRKKRRQSKNLAGKKASKESMALRDSMEKVNEK